LKWCRSEGKDISNARFYWEDFKRIQLMLAEWSIGISLMTAIFVGWVQYKNYRRSLRHVPGDLYDRQKKVMDVVMTFLAEACQQGDTNTEKLTQFLRDTKDAELYFPGSGVKVYVDELYKKGLNLEYTNKMLSDSHLPVGERREILAQQNLDILTDLSKQFAVARDLFNRYLKVRER
jgi:hypothetical protein